MLRVDLCHYVVTWRTRDRYVGQVYLSADGGPEDLFGTAGEASYEVPWIAGAQHLAFRLYAGTDRRRLIATSTITRRERGPETGTPTTTERDPA